MYSVRAGCCGAMHVFCACWMLLCHACILCVLDVAVTCHACILCVLDVAVPCMYSVCAGCSCVMHVFCVCWMLLCCVHVVRTGVHSTHNVLSNILVQIRRSLLTRFSLF